MRASLILFLRQYTFYLALNYVLLRSGGLPIRTTFLKCHCNYSPYPNVCFSNPLLGNTTFFHYSLGYLSWFDIKQLEIYSSLFDNHWIPTCCVKHQVISFYRKWRGITFSPYSIPHISLTYIIDKSFSIWLVLTLFSDNYILFKPITRQVDFIIHFVLLCRVVDAYI